MKLAEQFGRLLVRLWPLWLPLLLITAWPFARPIVREHIFGSPLLGSALSGSQLISLSDIGGELIWGGYQESVDPNPLPDALAQPNDLNLQVWQWNWSRSRNEIRSNSQGLVERFPKEIVAYALAIRELNPNHKIQTSGASAINADEIARLRTLAQKAAQLEPDNAYWWVQLATAQELSGRVHPALLALERAARCSFYDNKDREIVRRSLAAFAPRRTLTWEEKRAVFLLSQLYDSPRSARDWGERARAFAGRGQARGALRWSGALAGVGALMVGGETSMTISNVGRVWQREAWSVAEPRGTTARQRNSADFSERYALYATRNGRPELAAATRVQAARARQADALLTAARALSDNYWTTYYWLAPDGLGATLSAGQIGGVALMSAAIYLALWWMAANIFLWRASGEPSSRAARVTVSGGAVAALLGLATLTGYWFWRQSLRAPSAPGAPQSQFYETIYITLGIFAFVGAPWLLALAIAAHTLWRERAQFTLAPRVDLELQLSRFSRRLLRWALPVAVVGSALMLIGGWALAMAALWLDWRNVDVLSLLPPDRNGVTGSFSWNIGDEPWIFVYGILLCVVCLLVWFAKWRWGTPQRLRPLTHRALRLWKESLGCAVAWLMWVYLLLILLSLPTRARAEARFDAVLQRGEIAVVRDLMARD